MGLISKIKKIFSNKIDTTDIPDNKLISLVCNQYIKFGKVLDVKQGTVAVFVAKGKVADAFSEGSYRLELNNLPVLNRLLKLSKQSKKAVPNKFKAELYLINLKQFKQQNFASFDNIVVKDKRFKKFNVKIKGKFDFEVFSPVDFIEALLTQYGLIKDKIARCEISCWVAELAVKKIQKNKPNTEPLYERATECFEGVIDYVNKELFDCGIKVSSIDITETIFPKKIYKNVSLSYAEYNHKPKEQPVDEIDYTIYTQNISNQTAEQQDDKTTKSVIQQAEVVYQQNISNQDNDNVEYLNNKNTTQENNVLPEPEIVNTIGYKQCLNCGAYNSVKSEHCFNCKSKI